MTDKLTPSDRPAASTAAASPTMRRVLMTRTQVFQGPLPSPDMLREYEAASPGAVKAIIEMAAQEQAHRHEMDQGHLRSANAEMQRRSHAVTLGQAVSGLVSLGGIAGAVWCAAVNQPLAALVVATITAGPPGVMLLVQSLRPPQPGTPSVGPKPRDEA